MATQQRGAWQGPALLLVTVLVMGGIYGLRAWSPWKEASGGWAPVPETVSIETVHTEAWREHRTLLATLSPIMSVDLRTEVGGRLAKVAFESGETVAQGTVLAKLDSAIEDAELRAVNAELRALRLRLERTQALAHERGVSKMDADQVAADVDAASARAEGLRARIRQKSVIAPFDGQTGVRHHHPGQVVDPGVLITPLVSTSTARFVDFWVPQTMLASVPLGEAVTVRLHDERAQATVEVIEPSADATRRAVLVRARLDPAPTNWLPAMSAQVDVPNGDEVPRVIVPAAALVWSPVGALVYRVVPGDHGGEVVTANPVVVLSDLGDRVVLASGLTANQRIVTEGAFKLHEGSSVQAATEVAHE